MMPWDTRPYARSGGERNPSTATVSVTRQKQTHRSYPEHHPYSTATITSVTARRHRNWPKNSPTQPTARRASPAGTERPSWNAATTARNEGTWRKSPSTGQSPAMDEPVPGLFTDSRLLTAGRRTNKMNKENPIFVFPVYHNKYHAWFSRFSAGYPVPSCWFFSSRQA